MVPDAFPNLNAIIIHSNVLPIWIMIMDGWLETKLSLPRLVIFLSIHPFLLFIRLLQHLYKYMRLVLCSS